MQWLNRSLFLALHGPDGAESASLWWAQLLLKAAVSHEKESMLTRSWCWNERLYTVISCSNGQRKDGREHHKKSLKKLPQVLNMAQHSVHTVWILKLLRWSILATAVTVWSHNTLISVTETYKPNTNPYAMLLWCSLFFFVFFFSSLTALGII